MSTITLTEASSRFLELARHVCLKKEETLVTDHGSPLVKLLPADKISNGAELYDSWKDLPHLDIDEAGLLEKDLSESRAQLPAVVSKWA